jgi:tetratricopeptide (TPR) repeat protein
MIRIIEVAVLSICLAPFACGQGTLPAKPDDQAVERLQKDALAKADEANLHALDLYEQQVRDFFNVESFEKIDKMADSARANRTRLTGGYWAIHLIYDALSHPRHGTFDSTESEWKLHLDRLQRWVGQTPQSITAHVALAEATLQYAWKARGGGYANEVTDDGWQAFHERSQTAEKILVDAFNLPVKCPEWYLAMQLVMRSQDMNKEKLTAMFEKAIAFEPDYQYYYRVQAETLLPKWDGEEGEMAVFAGQIADRIGGKKGDIIYYQIATFVNCSCDSRNQPNGMSWPRIKRGYAAAIEQYGTSLVSMNQMAQFAAAAGDPDFAQELLTRIGENWDPDAWHTREYFETVRKWAGYAHEAERSQEDGIKAAEDNLKTAAGRQFDEQMAKAFQSGYSDILTSCMKLSRVQSFAPFDLVLRIGKTGSVEQLFANPTSPLLFCLARPMMSDHFPVPPEPSYWVKVSVHGQP